MACRALASDMEKLRSASPFSISQSVVSKLVAPGSVKHHSTRPAYLVPSRVLQAEAEKINSVRCPGFDASSEMQSLLTQVPTGTFISPFNVH